MAKPKVKKEYKNPYRNHYPTVSDLEKDCEFIAQFDLNVWYQTASGFIFIIPADDMRDLIETHNLGEGDLKNLPANITGKYIEKQAYDVAYREANQGYV